MEKVNSEKSFLLSLFSSMPLCPVEAANITWVFSSLYTFDGDMDREVMLTVVNDLHTTLFSFT